MLRRRRQRAALTKPTAADLGFPFLFSIDTPFDKRRVVHSAQIRGWVGVPKSADVEGPWIKHSASVMLAQETRPDVERIHPTLRVIGFRDFVEVSDIGAATMPWLLEVQVDGVGYCTPILNVEVSEEEWRRFTIDKASKLARIESLLRCPALLCSEGTERVCGGHLEREGDVGLRCVSCSERYAGTDRCFDFLGSDRHTARFQSDHEHLAAGYGDPRARALVADVDARGGLMLDNGSGLQSHYYPSVVNLDIVDYATTDVVGLGERLPFADATFDAVLSVSVLEHVRNPFACVAEIERVLKPGGIVHVWAPHLQPYHGYPSHYFNMTSQGLEWLFSDFDVRTSETPDDCGHPMWAIGWILRAYTDGLPLSMRETFREMRVRDLTGSGLDYVEQDFFRLLDDETRRALACNNYVVATKRRR
jgi:SAM-dependent methyltransferase